MVLDRLCCRADDRSSWYPCRNSHSAVQRLQDESSMNGHYTSMLSLKITRHRLNALLILGIGIGGLIFLYNFNPSDSFIYPPCPFHALTGLHCPGCGSTRALYQLLHGHLLTAFRLNPLMVLLLPFLGYSLLSYLSDGIMEKSLPRIFIPASFIWILLGVILLFWIFRNLPFFPFLMSAL